MTLTVTPTVTAAAFVIDASVTAAWLLPDERTAAAEQAYAKLRGSVVDAHAPELWLWQCGNIIANGVKRQRITEPDAAHVWNLLDSVRTRVELVTLQPNQMRACLALALDEALSIDDAAYLWLAMSLQLPLLTHDDRLSAAAARQNVAALRLENLT